MKHIAPRARNESLIVRALPDEVLVYDLEAGKAHCLNRTAAFVWDNCDGRKTVGEITRLLEKELDAPVDPKLVWLALDQLEGFKLLREPLTKPAHVRNISRRQLVRSLGVVAITLPLITSIVAPTAAQAASGLAPGGCCVNPNQCQSGSCDQSPVCTGIPGPSTKACA